ncbi:MAG: carboxy-S-adenosyl-L-methionine synthase CmoA [Pseudomonadota bacterium]
MSKLPSSPHEHDNLFAQPIPQLGQFEFDRDVVNVFPDMINRSVPGYPTIVNMIGYLAAKYYQPGSHCYDLGCSLGAASLSIWHAQPSANIIGIDTSPAMIEQCQKLVVAKGAEQSIQLHTQNICDFAYTNASVVVLNFTLQFIPVEQRDALIQRIYNAMLPGSLLIVSEKIRFNDDAINQLNIELHENFKRRNGYTELEISQKRQALEKVLIPETMDDHRQRFEKAGFTKFDAWFQCFNFVSMLACK